MKRFRHKNLMLAPFTISCPSQMFSGCHLASVMIQAVLRNLYLDTSRRDRRAAHYPTITTHPFQS